jgi:hypothetical protein
MSSRATSIAFRIVGVAALAITSCAPASSQQDAAVPAKQDDPPLAELTKPLDARAYGIGEIVPDLSFTDLDGKDGRLSDFVERDALVVVIRDVGCPVSRKYGLRTAEIERAYAPRNVAFLYVDVSRQDSVEDCRGEAKEYGFAGRYARDPEGRFAWHLKARTTTDVFVLDGERRLRYRGAIDDQIGRGVTKPKATCEYLKEALESVLKNERVSDPAMTAPGCDLPTFREAPAEPPVPGLDWHGRVEWIVQEKCQRCHRKGGAAPFTLTSLDDIAGNEARIRQALLDRVMPPWFATKDSGPFKEDLGLSDEQRRDLLRWLQSGCPEGDPSKAPPPREWPEGWLIGEPDLVVEAPEVDIPATGIVDYLKPEVPIPLDHDVWIQAMQIRAEHPEICHHVLAIARYDDNTQDFLDSYLPGRGPTTYPEGMAVLLQTGANLLFNLHYTPNGKPVKERTKIGFKFATKPPEQRVTGRIVRGYEIVIQPNEKAHTSIVDHRIPVDATLRRLVPHMHLRGWASKVELLFPDGTKKTPLDLPRWNPNWQFGYELDPPIFLPKGTVIRSTSVWDNSADNPFNPDPAATVLQGPQIYNEMGGVFVEWYRPVHAKQEPRDAADPAADKQQAGGK